MHMVRRAQNRDSLGNWLRIAVAVDVDVSQVASLVDMEHDLERLVGRPQVKRALKDRASAADTRPQRLNTRLWRNANAKAVAAAVTELRDLSHGELSSKPVWKRKLGLMDQEAFPELQPRDVHHRPLTPKLSRGAKLA